MPGSSERMLAKAATADADMVMFDLEDAVAPAEKPAARAAVARAVRTGDWRDRVVGVRVNGWGSPWTLSDLDELVGGCDGRLDVVVLPKVEEPGMLRALDLVLTQLEHRAGLGRRIGIEAQIESAGGVHHLAAIVGASDRLEVIALGPLDLAASLGMRATSGRGRARLDPVAVAMVVAGRAAGVQVLDGPYVHVHDLDGLRHDARWAADLGFDGKWALHPCQLPVIHEELTPTDDEVADAARLVERYEAAVGGDGRGAVLVDGEMVDEASARGARRVLERARRGPDRAR